MTDSTDPSAGRVVVLDVVGLRPEHVDPDRAPNLSELFDGRPTPALEPPFPAVTIPAQTTLATGRSPAGHGDVSNGEYDRERETVALWERERGDRNRLWEAASDEAGVTTGALFFQHLIGTTADVAVTPAPIEDENDNLIEMNCWTNPDGFYDELESTYGHFPLHNYWGPGAGAASSEWILDAAREAIQRYDPDLLWVYLPHMDYDGQRYGPNTPELEASLETVDELLGAFLTWLRSTQRWSETAVAVLSEYGFHDVDRTVFPNCALRDAGLLTVTDDGEGGEEVDLDGSRAFAMVDHQAAHVFTDVPEEARRVLDRLDGVAEVMGDEAKAAHDLDHRNAGELVLVAESDAWFQYYWWHDEADAPFYATDMDIHAKPGFDPCELFVGESGLVTTDPTRVSGSHGRVDESVFGVFGLAGPATPDDALSTDTVDARAVAPTVADLLGIADLVSLDFERPSRL